MKYLYTLVLLIAVTKAVCASEKQNWIINLAGSGLSYNTLTQEGSRKGISRKGLISISKSGDNSLEVYWEPGAYRATTLFNRSTLIDGHDLEDVSRIKSFKFNKNGDTAYIRTIKGPKAVVDLIYNGRSIMTWPRLSMVSIQSFQNDGFYIAFYSKENQATEFWYYQIPINKQSQSSGKIIGTLKGCVLLSSKVMKTGIALQTYCDPVRGSDVAFLDFKTGIIQNIKATGEDEILAFSLMKKSNGNISVLSISGSTAGRTFFHGVTQSLTKYLGEPISYSSDESGKQSWSQSYRTLALANLYKKTGHTVFARLAEQAMARTLDQQNQLNSITGDNNPSCAWASRIYSKDGKSPISFMINQGMISSGLIYSCKMLGDQCPLKLKQQITNNASCLVLSYEKHYSPIDGLYRIPYGAPFRYDGIWAPWNWHMMWSSVLDYVGRENNEPKIIARAQDITKQFLNSWQITKEDNARVLWRYWPIQYYQGWREEDLISETRAKQKPKNMQKERYEDINHASISLLGLSHMNIPLPNQYQKDLKNTLNDLLNYGALLPRDMDGKGPISPRWLPGAGWHTTATNLLKKRYSRFLPGASTGDQHLAYTQIFNAKDDFSLELTLSQCQKSSCETAKDWVFHSSRDFISNNPIFTITEIH